MITNPPSQSGPPLRLKPDAPTTLPPAPVPGPTGPVPADQYEDTLSPAPTRTVASVDNLIDENGNPIPVPEEAAEVRLAHDVEEAVAATSPANWSRIGLFVLAAIIAVLLLMQMLGGNPGTDVQPGTPTAAPVSPSAPAGI
jgi:hypothetical protein